MRGAEPDGQRLAVARVALGAVGNALGSRRSRVNDPNLAVLTRRGYGRAVGPPRQALHHVVVTDQRCVGTTTTTSSLFTSAPLNNTRQLVSQRSSDT